MRLDPQTEHRRPLVESVNTSPYRRSQTSARVQVPWPAYHQTSMPNLRPRSHPCGVLTCPNGPVASTVHWATTFRARRRGVLGRPPLRPDEALVIRPCRRVHTFGVAYPLDVVFCDRDLRVLHVETLEPGRMSERVRAARICIELAGGRAAACSLEPGVELRFEAAA